MTTPLVLDIETVATQAALALPYPIADRPHPENYKKEEAIAAWRERDRAKWESERAKQCSLDPRLGRVFAFGFKLGDAKPFVWTAVDEGAEANILGTFWSLAREARGRVVTWNGSFDLRFLVVRSLIKGVEPTLPSDVIRSWFQRYRVAPHFDCRALVTNWDSYAEGTLGEWSRALGVEYRDDVSGADVWALYQANDYKAIADHCEADVVATHQLYEKLGRMFASEAA